MTRPEVDIEAISEKWLRQCSACDAGLAMSCTCPEGDPRNVISNLVDEIKRLRGEMPGGVTHEVFTVRTRGVIWPGIPTEARAWEQLAKTKAWSDKPRVRIDKQTITEWPDSRQHISPYEYVGGDFALDGDPNS